MIALDAELFAPIVKVDALRCEVHGLRLCTPEPCQKKDALFACSALLLTGKWSHRDGIGRLGSNESGEKLYLGLGRSLSAVADDTSDNCKKPGAT